jgi:hypothetical protein
MSKNATKNPGVVETIAKCLLSASEKKPITKEQILAKLTKTFPDRDVEKMRATINAQVPGRIAKGQEIDVYTLGDRYWAEA